MPVTLLFGDNQIEIDDALRKIRTAYNSADVLTFEGATADLSALSEACRTAGLFDPERLILVHNLHARVKGGKKEGGDVEEIRRILQDVAPTTALTLLSPGMTGDNLMVALVRDAGGTIQSLTVPRKNDVPRWLTARARSHGIAIDRDAAVLLAELVGPDTVALDTELEKLATYAGSGGTIDVPAVDTLVGAVTQDSIFALVDAIAAGDDSQALGLVHSQIQSASTNPIEFALYVIRMLARQMRILLRIRLGQEAGRQQRELISQLRLPPYYADRYFRQAKRLSPQRLMGTFEGLAALEYELKQGKTDPATGLDLLVSELCS